MPYNFQKESRTYRILFYAVVLISIPILCYAIYTAVIFTTVSFSHAPSIKLNRNEKRLVKDIEKECSCDVNFKHNYDLIKNPDGRKYTYTDSTLTIGLYFNKETIFGIHKKGEDLCQRDSLFLVTYGMSIARKLISTMNYMNYYQYITIVYASYNQDMSCYKLITLKREQNDSLIVVR